jgi:hypothetical protein
MDLPETTTRVTMNSTEKMNRRIRQDMEMRIWYYTQNPHKIDERLRELDEEWDMERTLETNAASLALFGTVMGLLGARKFLFIPGMVTGFLLQHALQGWCPPVPLFRRIGIRTQSEIEAERYALKALRGDFRQSSEEGDDAQRIEQTLRVVGMEQSSMGAEGQRLH